MAIAITRKGLALLNKGPGDESTEIDLDLLWSIRELTKEKGIVTIPLITEDTKRERIEVITDLARMRREGLIDSVTFDSEKAK